MFQRRNHSTISQSIHQGKSKPTISGLHNLNQQITDENIADVGLYSSARAPILSGQNIKRGSNKLMTQKGDSMQMTSQNFNIGQTTPLQIGDRHFQMHENNLGKTLPQFEQQSQRITEESQDNSNRIKFKIPLNTLNGANDKTQVDSDIQSVQYINYPNELDHGSTNQQSILALTHQNDQIKRANRRIESSIQQFNNSKNSTNWLLQSSKINLGQTHSECTVNFDSNSFSGRQFILNHTHVKSNVFKTLKDDNSRLTDQVVQDLRRKSEKPLYHQTLSTLDEKRMVEQVNFAASTTKSLIKRKISEDNQHDLKYILLDQQKKLSEYPDQRSASVQPTIKQLNEEKKQIERDIKRQKELQILYDVETQLTKQYENEVLATQSDWNEKIRAILQGQYYDQRDLDSEQLFERLLKGRKLPLHSTKLIRQIWRKNLDQVIQREKFDELERIKEEEIAARKEEIKQRIKDKLMMSFNFEGISNISCKQIGKMKLDGGFQLKKVSLGGPLVSPKADEAEKEEKKGKVKPKPSIITKKKLSSLKISDKEEQKPPAVKQVILKQPSAAKLSIKADKLLNDLSQALAKDPKLRKYLEGTKINRKEFNVDFSKVDPESDIKKFNKRMENEFAKSKMQSEPIDMGMTLMEILKQNEIKQSNKKEIKNVPSLEAHEQTLQILQKMSTFKANKESFDSPVKKNIHKELPGQIVFDEVHKISPSKKSRMVLSESPSPLKLQKHVSDKFEEYAFFPPPEPSKEERRHHHVALPIYSRTLGSDETTLRLINYSFSNESNSNVKGMAESLQFSKIQRMHIEKCGISNPQIFASLIENIEGTNDFKSLVIRSEELQFRPNLFQNVLQKHEPLHLEELKIEFCKVDTKSINSLTRTLKEMSAQYVASPALKTLSLVDANLAGQKESVENLISYLVRNHNIRDLNLSWNNLRQPPLILDLMSSFNFKRGQFSRIQNLNLSWNCLFIEPKKDDYYDEEDDYQQEEEVTPLSLIIKFIQSSKYIQHIDLSHTFLEYEGFQQLTNAVKSQKCQSLQVMHLSGNPFLLKLDWYKKIRETKNPDDAGVLDSNQESSKKEYEFQEDFLQDLHSKARQPDQHGLPYAKPVKVFKIDTKPVGDQYQVIDEKAQKMKLKHIREQMMFSKPQDLKTDSPGEIFIFSRNCHFKIGPHGSQDTGSEGQWKIMRDQIHECWYCQSHNPSIVCFEVGDPSLREVEVSQATMRHLDFIDDCDYPQVACEANNFEGQKLLPVKEVAKLAGLSSARNWQMAFYKNTHFKKLNLVNLRESSIFKEEGMFVTWPPLFIKPGKNNFIYKYKDKFYQNHQIVNPRTETLVPDFHILDKQKSDFEAHKKNNYMIKGENMIFEQLKDKNQDEIYESCMDSDFCFWKAVQRAEIIFPDATLIPTEQAETLIRMTREIFFNHKTWIYRTFTELAAKSNYPYASKEVIKEWIFNNNFGIFIKSENFDTKGRYCYPTINKWARPQEQQRVEKQLDRLLSNIMHGLLPGESPEKRKRASHRNLVSTLGLTRIQFLELFVFLMKRRFFPVPHDLDHSQEQFLQLDSTFSQESSLESPRSPDSPKKLKSPKSPSPIKFDLKKQFELKLKLQISTKSPSLFSPSKAKNQSLSSIRVKDEALIEKKLREIDKGDRDIRTLNLNNLLERFFTEDLKAHYTPPDSFTIKELLVRGPESLAIDQYIQQESIKTGLEKTFMKFAQGKGLWSKLVAINFLQEQMGLEKQEAIFCFATAKTPVDEVTGSHYERVYLTEFIELILRASILKFKKVGKDDASLLEKLESACKIAIDSVVNIPK